MTKKVWILKNCPNCGGICDREEIDARVGTRYDTWYCESPDCGWEEQNSDRKVLGMKIIKTVMKLDGKSYYVAMPVEKEETLEDYEKSLEATKRAMLRLIQKKIFNYSKRELILECIKGE